MAELSRENRIGWIDCAKGITMLLVIFGHTLPVEVVPDVMVRGLIFSFHMPLFFILSCVTFQLSENAEQFRRKTKKAFIHLIVPALVLYGLRIIIDLIQNAQNLDLGPYFLDRLLSLVFASGVKVSLPGFTVPAWGMMWFLVVLFSARTLYDLLHLVLPKKIFIVVLCVCTGLGLLFGHIQWLPFSFDLTLAIMPFMWFGCLLKNADLKKKQTAFFLLSVVVWAGTLLLSYFVSMNYLELAARRYPLFPICYITAIAGTMAACYLCIWIEKCKCRFRPLSWIGKNSLYLLCIHIMDYVIRPVWEVSGSSYLNTVVRIAADLILLILLVEIRKRILNLKSRSL